MSVIFEMVDGDKINGVRGDLLYLNKVGKYSVEKVKLLLQGDDCLPDIAIGDSPGMGPIYFVRCCNESREQFPIAGQGHRSIMKL